MRSSRHRPPRPLRSGSSRTGTSSCRAQSHSGSAKWRIRAAASARCRRRSLRTFRPARANGRFNSGSRIRRKIRARNSKLKLAPYSRMSSVISRSKPKPRHSAHPAAQATDRHPGRARLGGAGGRTRRQHAVLRHRQRQPRVAHHQRVEHAEAAHHAACHQRDAQPGSAHQSGDVGPRARLQALAGSPVIHMAAEGRM